ncbi:NADH-quinone oxidoreductase subunit M [Thiotrichales bacterium 19S11-10]|nr:NADH-quinone oxidoreductase subunit M [Thiotrichales bacterium 19S11-10]MCF6806978.1 NADH-quinone oxidoreductase subunit M [Thiotrichales bacterium 19S9-11]MCF6810947.1 NADH-quinone oxidoreductase subunit M [Thiotrichales bacterium 19S9-12]
MLYLTNFYDWLLLELSAAHGTLLDILIWLPIVGSFFVMILFNDDKKALTARWVALVIAIITFLFSLLLYANFNALSDKMQFLQVVNWIPIINAKYALGVDGISVLFIMLTSFTTVIIILGAWKTIHVKVSQHMSIFLMTCGITNGVFSAMDSLLFYVFWEASLIPMTLAIGIWGGQNRVYAAMKFFLYAFFGSVFMLIAILYLYSETGSFMIQDFYNLRLPVEVQWLLTLSFWIAFAVKVPMWPVHTWLPDAHTEAPAGGSVVLAALMLKMGAYGFIRFSLPMFPEIHMSIDEFLIGLSLIAIVYVGIASIVQKDAKRLIAYSSISHMGIVTLGIFSVFLIFARTGHTDSALLGVQGAVFQMIAHAFSSGGLFIGISFLSARMKTRMIDDYQGVAFSMPIFAAFFMLFCLANVGLPGTSGFVGEFLVILGVFKASPLLALLAGLTLILAPAYTLWMYKRVIFGKVKNEKIQALKDISGVEILVFVLLAIPTIWFGIYPEPILHLSQAASNGFIQYLNIQ